MSEKEYQSRRMYVNGHGSASHFPRDNKLAFPPFYLVRFIFLSPPPSRASLGFRHRLFSAARKIRASIKMQLRKRLASNTDCVLLFARERWLLLARPSNDFLLHPSLPLLSSLSSLLLSGPSKFSPPVLRWLSLG